MQTRKLMGSLVLCVLAAACSVAPNRNSLPITPPPPGSAEESREVFVGAPPPVVEPQEARARTAKVAVNDTVTNIPVSNGVDEDTEPTVSALNLLGGDRTSVAFIKITPSPDLTQMPFVARIHTTSTWSLDGGFPTPVPVVAPFSVFTGQRYAHTADPYLSANIRTTGVAPLRTYLVGLAYNMTSRGIHPNGAVTIWRSDDGGGTWTAPVKVAEAQSPRVLDKPHMVVSWNETAYDPDGNGATAGHVYVTWVDVPSNNDTSDLRIMFSRSIDGGQTFSTPQILATGYVHAPQIVVPANTGRVFVLYARYNSSNTRVNSIEMVRSTNAGVTFSAQPTLSNTRMLGPSTDSLNTGAGLKKTQARSVFQAEYNAGAGIQVVWHGEDPNNTAQTDIYYAGFSGSWAMKNITPSVPGDQWNPSFAIDAARYARVVWLDRRNDPQNLTYQPYYTKINTSGTPIQTAAPLDTATNLAGHYQRSPAVGEYCDTYYWGYATGSRFVTVWPRIYGLDNGDIHASVIAP